MLAAGEESLEVYLSMRHLQVHINDGELFITQLHMAYAKLTPVGICCR